MSASFIGPKWRITKCFIFDDGFLAQNPIFCKDRKISSFDSKRVVVFISFFVLSTCFQSSCLSLLHKDIGSTPCRTLPMCVWCLKQLSVSCCQPFRTATTLLSLAFRSQSFTAFFQHLPATAGRLVADFGIYLNQTFIHHVILTKYWFELQRYVFLSFRPSFRAKNGVIAGRFLTYVNSVVV